MIRLIQSALLASMCVLVAPAFAQATYPTPEAAADALVDGIARSDDDAVRAALGPQYKKFVPGDAVKAGDVTRFLEAWAKSHRIVRKGDAEAHLEVGTNGWTLPIPIEKSASGWRFDVTRAPEEMRWRRIGRNELDVIQVVQALGDAQQDYMKLNKSYAQKILSTPGKRDGLYWPTREGEPDSPLGPIADGVKPGDAYHGYRYRILTAQGAAAPGGAISYVKDGKMTGGYAFVAWPARYGDTGVMTFIVAGDGVVYQKDLGPETDRIARAMRAYDPAGWTRAN
ncbi:MAG: DUF2950 domain-containing protein [Burkholderiales bacterium]